MKKKSVTKKVKTSKRASAPQTEMPDLVAVMLKLTERLEAVERKMDVVINRAGNQQPQRHEHSQPRQHQPFQQQNQHRPQRHSEPNFNRAPQQHPQNQNRQQGGKPMYQAVCTDCRKNCEVPFRPSGERPTYCKECYGKRKSGGNVSKPNPAAFQMMEKRQLKVVSNGVGKTVISEMVPAKKNSKPAKKVKK